MRIKSVCCGFFAAAVMCAAGSVPFGQTCFGENAQDIPVFDPRPDGVSAVRRQEWGICWAMAGISTMESALIREKLADSSISLSTEDMLWWANVNTEGGWANARRNDGGYSPMAIGYLVTRGVRSLADIPDLGAPSDPDDMETDYYEEGQNQRPAAYDSAPELFEASAVAFYEQPSEDEVKRAILDYGAVSATYCDEADYFNEETSSAWHPYNEMYEANHFISVVGWDDTFPKENFKCGPDGEAPQRDGAWLIKNSYGTDYGSDGGYTYISYDDGYLFRDTEDLAYAVAGACAPMDGIRYMLDEFGPVSLIHLPGESFTAAAVYEFGADETITQIAFTAGGAGAEYEICYAGVNEGTGSAGSKDNVFVPDADESGWKVLTKGTIPYAGYHTVSIDPFEVPQGNGAVILRLSGSDLSVGVEESLTKQNGRPKYFSVLSDRSFVLGADGFEKAQRERSENGMSYTEGYDVSLRAWTARR